MLYTQAFFPACGPPAATCTFDRHDFTAFHRPMNAQAPIPPLDRDGLRISGTPLDQARRILMVTPGALTRLDTFSPLTQALPSGTALVELAFPGLDGRPMDSPVRVRATGRRIAARLNASPAKRIDLVGISAGAAICFEIRGRLTCPDVTFAAIAAPAPFPYLLASVIVMGVDILKLRSQLRGEPWQVIWFEVFQILLFGHTPRRPPLPVDAGGRTAGPSVTPTFRMLFFHGIGTAFWTPSRRARRPDTPVRFFHGTHDPVSPSAAVARFAARLKNADVTWYRDRGHLPHIMNPELYAEIRRFWRYRGKTPT